MTPFQKTFLAAFLSGLLLTACGGSIRQVESIQPVKKSSIQGANPSEKMKNARIAASGGSLLCPFEEECNPWVAMVSVANENGLYRCSGVLIGADQVLTNAHCVNRESDGAAKGCAGDLFVHFARFREKGEVHRGCKSIEALSREAGIDAPDYALIRLDSPVEDRGSAELSMRGFANGEAASIYRVQMMEGQNGEFDGSQSLLACHADYGTFLFPEVKSSRSSLMTFGDCAIQSGNSGSPVFNQDGALGALLQGYLVPEAGSDLERSVKAELLDGSFGETGVAAQVACLPLSGSKPPVACGPNPLRRNQTVSGFFRKSGGLVLPALPDPGAERSWVPLTTEREFIKAFAAISACRTTEGFEARVIEYRLGLDRKLLPQWRKVEGSGETPVGFRLFSGDAGTQGPVFSASPDYRLIGTSCR